MNNYTPCTFSINSFGTVPKLAIRRASSQKVRYLQLNSSLLGLSPIHLNGSSLRDLKSCLNRSEIIPTGYDLVEMNALLKSSSKYDEAMYLFNCAKKAMSYLGVKKINIRLPDIHNDKLENFIRELQISTNSDFVSPVLFGDMKDINYFGIEINENSSFKIDKIRSSPSFIRVFLSEINGQLIAGKDDFFTVMQTCIASCGISSVVAIPNNHKTLSKALKLNFHN